MSTDDSATPASELPADTPDTAGSYYRKTATMPILNRDVSSVEMS